MTQNTKPTFRDKLLNHRILSVIAGSALVVGVGTGATVWAHPDLSVQTIMARLSGPSHPTIPVNLADTSLDFSDAQEIALTELGDGDVNRILFRADETINQDALVFTVRVSDSDEFSEVTHVTIDAATGEIVGTETGELGLANQPAAIDMAEVPVTPIEAQEIAREQFPGGEVTQVMLRGTPRGEVIYTVRVVEGERQINVNINATTGAVTGSVDQ